jgi:hypothetical protein
VNDFDAAIFLLAGRGLMGTTEVGCEMIGVWEDMVPAIISQSGHLHLMSALCSWMVKL